MSNFPPGVTGNELEIAGPDWDGEVDRACSQTNVTLFVLTSDASATIRLWNLIHPGEAMNAEQMLGLCAEIELDECPFEGEANAWSYGGVLHWECPVCGHEYEEDGRDE